MVDKLLVLVDKESFVVGIRVIVTVAEGILDKVVLLGFDLDTVPRPIACVKQLCFYTTPWQNYSHFSI